MKVTVVPSWSAMATRRKTRTTTVTRTRTVVQGSFAFVSSSYLGGYLLLSAITIVSHLRTEAGGRWGGGWGWGVRSRRIRDSDNGPDPAQRPPTRVRPPSEAAQAGNRRLAIRTRIGCGSNMPGRRQGRGGASAAACKPWAAGDRRTGLARKRAWGGGRGQIRAIVCLRASRGLAEDAGGCWHPSRRVPPEQCRQAASCLRRMCAGARAADVGGGRGATTRASKPVACGPCAPRCVASRCAAPRFWEHIP